jgi:hypothetical protein
MLKLTTADEKMATEDNLSRPSPESCVIDQEENVHRALTFYGSSDCSLSGKQESHSAAQIKSASNSSNGRIEEKNSTLQEFNCDSILEATVFKARTYATRFQADPSGWSS